MIVVCKFPTGIVAGYPKQNSRKHVGIHHGGHADDPPVIEADAHGTPEVQAGTIEHGHEGVVSRAHNPTLAEIVLAGLLPGYPPLGEDLPV